MYTQIQEERLSLLTPKERYELAITILSTKLIRFHPATDWPIILTRIQKDVFSQAFEDTVNKNGK